LRGKKRMEDMADKTTGAADTPPETADVELEASVASIISEVVLPEGEAPEPAPEPQAEVPVQEADASDEPVLSQEISAPPEREEAKEESGDGDLSPEIQRAIDKRIAKAVAKQKSAEERASDAEAKTEELNSKLDELKDQPTLAEQTSRGESPVDRVQTLEDLKKEEQRAEQILDWSDDMLMQMKSEPDAVAEELKKQKVDLRDSYGEDDYTPERMDLFLSQLRRNADRNLRKSVPERRQYLETKKVSDAQGKELMPQMEDESSQFYQDTVDVMNTLPELTRLPHHKTAAGVFALGLEQLRQIEAEQKSNRAKSAEPPSSQPGIPSAAPAVESSAQPEKGANALKSWKESGEPEDFDKFIETLV
jgi:murein DD-endopeptidase MepM/ murein hydrolase activator NlpD